MESHECDICERGFKSKGALEQHNLAKHASKKAEKKKTNFDWGEIKVWLIIVGVIGLIFWGVSALMSAGGSCQEDPAEEINIGGHTNLAMHIHPRLEIIIDGVVERLPANIGIGPGLMRPIHTHDSSGELHVEGPCRRDFFLGDFFKIWDREFSSECIFDKCVGEGELKMSINGVESQEFENLILRDYDRVRIEFASFK
jgi:hypothetical protein